SRTSYGELVASSAKVYKLLGLNNRRGHVRRDAFADLAVFSTGNKAEEKTAAEFKHLARVIVAGETVWENGKRTGGSPGVFLRRA
ncbi:MAG: hypothetical protein JF612_14235, partial [Planctomycetia bacterium]|nr:hypothetical protein [Planctomycetia bacterium]